MNNLFLLMYIDTTREDPLFEVEHFDSQDDALAYCHKVFAEKKWAGPAIGVFKFQPDTWSWPFIGEVHK